ncbi:MAG: hypothetical protein AAF741_00040 [Bacteroidota bacterium]
MISRTKSYRGLFARLCMVVTITCLTTVLGNAQGFEFSFGGPKEDQGQALLATSDHGYLEVGFTEGQSGDDNDIDIFVVRTDKDGKALWQQSYDAGFEEYGFDLVRRPDGDFYIIGDRKVAVGDPFSGYLIRIDKLGNLVSTNDYFAGDQNLRLKRIIPASNGTGYVLVGSLQLEATGRDAALVIFTDNDGQELDRKVFSGGYDDRVTGAVAFDDGYLFALNRDDQDGNLDIVLLRTDLDGNELQTVVWGTVEGDERVEDLIRTSDGNVAFCGSTNNTGLSLLAKADLNGDTLWITEIDASEFGEGLKSLIEEDDGSTITAAGDALRNPIDGDVLLTKVSSVTGQQIWQRLLGDEGVFNTATDVVATPEQGYAIAAYNSQFGVIFNDLTLYKTNGEGEFFTNVINGRVYNSEDGCNPYEDGDLGLKDWLVSAVRTDGEAAFFGSTDGDGFFDIQVDTGNYQVTLLQKNNRWEICDPAEIQVSLPELYDTSYQEFALTTSIACPLLEVDLSAGPAVACEEQIINVSYGNQGAATATDVSLEIELDPALTLIGSTLPPSSQNGNLLIFDLADLAPNDSEEFTLTVMVSCGLVEEESISTRATILPDFNATCAPEPMDWDGAIIEVEGECEGDSISFKIRNVGSMLESTLNYIVVEDQVLIRPAVEFNQDSFDMAIGQEILVREENTGGTFRLIAEQSPNYNGNLFPTAVVEGCEGGPIEFTTGAVAQFPDNDGNLNIDILTQEVLVFDIEIPLALRAYPRGYQDSIITPTTDLEYTIFFGLGDTSTLERVVIRDTLSPMLDFNSLEVGASSHPYDFVLSQNGVLKITFDSIQLLADGGTGGVDPSPRQGYVTYRLSQKPNNSVGTVINNRAAVYFDYREPVFTNRVRHVVGCEDLFNSNCLLTNSSNFPSENSVNISVFPHPLTDISTVRLENWKSLDIQLEWRMYDGNGRLLRQQFPRGDQFEIGRHNLPNGSYVYELWGDGRLIAKGTIFVQ